MSRRTLTRLMRPILLFLLVIGSLSLTSKLQTANASGTTIGVVNPVTGGNEFTFSTATPINSSFIANITVTNVSFLTTWQISMSWDPELLIINRTADIIIPPDNIFGAYTELLGLTITDSNVFCVYTIKLGSPFQHVNVTYGTMCQIRFTLIKNDTKPLSCSIHFLQQDENPFYTKLIDINANLILHTLNDGAYEMLPPGTIIVPRDYATIQEAINHVNVGDIIFVRRGVYYEHLVINKTVSLFGSMKTAIIDGGYVGNVIEVTADNITITGFVIRKSGKETTVPPDSGIGLQHVRNCSISENNITTNSVGIWLENSSNNNIYKNNIENNDVGIRLLGSSSNVISENNITNNNDGIFLDLSSNNNMSSNSIMGNDRYGMFLINSSSVISKNNIKVNSLGIFLYDSSNSSVLSNNFLENLQHAYALKSHNNLWDDGYPSGGNYWSSYTGVDFYHGSYQNETGSDGIGDISRIIEEDNIDRYPLMKLHPWASHDIGITSVIASKTVIEQGLVLRINVTMFNYGNNTENFNVTAYANTTSIQTVSVILTEKNSTTITFSWNTSGFSCAHVLSVNATPVDGEANTDDNTFVYGVVKVSCTGDVNGDYVTDGQDFQLVKRAIPSTPSSPNWNPNADLNDDGIVDGQDFQIVKNHIPSRLPT